MEAGTFMPPRCDALQLSRDPAHAFVVTPLVCHDPVPRDHKDWPLVLATVPLRARLTGHPVVAVLPVPTDDLIPVAGGPS